MIFCRQLHDFLSTRLSDNLFSVIHATVAYLDGIAVEDFSKLVVFRKVFVYWRVRNLCPKLVLTFLLNGGLYQRMFRCLFLRLEVVVGW